MAVYTHISTADLAEFLAGYSVGELISYEGIAEGVENTNYFVTTSAGRFVLTLYEKRVAFADLPFFLGLMAHLAGKNISCPKPVATQVGTILSSLAARPASLASVLPGASLLEWTPQNCFAVGRALAELHLGAEDFTGARDNALGLAGWKTLAQKTAAEAGFVMPGLETQIASEIEYLTAHWPEDLPRGIIHADFFPDNVLFEHEKVSGIIDFYFACTDILAYDLAIALNCWCFDGQNFNFAKGKNLISGYQSLRALSPKEAKQLPVLIRGAALRFLLTRLYDLLNPAPGAVVKAKDPLEYYDKLLFHHGVSDAADYGYHANV